MVIAGLAAVIAVGTLAFLLHALEVFGGGGGRFPYGFFGLHVVALAAWGLFSHVQRGAQARSVLGAARIDRRGLVHRSEEGATLTVPRHAVRDGIYRAGRLRLLGPLQRVVFEAKMDAESAQAALHALGLDAASHRAEFRAAAPVFATLARQLVFLGVAAVLFHAVPLDGMLGMPVGFALLFGLAMWPARITVGTDGFLFRWLWWRRFVAMHEVQSITTEAERDVVLGLSSGKRLVWYTSMRAKSTSADQRDHRDAVVARMREAHALATTRPHAPHLADSVGRVGRTHDEWLAALRQLRGPVDDYRAAAVPRDDLWRILEDPAAPEDARAGAAYVLRADGASEHVEQRLRNAAGATVSPQLRIALDSAAEGTEDELSAALEELDSTPLSLVRQQR